MNRYFFITLLCLFIRIVSNGQEKEHLLPLLSNFDMYDVLIKYDQVVRDHLVRDGKRLHGSLARVVVQSTLILPFSWQIDRSLDKDSTYFLTYKQSMVNIWQKVYNNIDISDSDIKKICVEISKEEAQSIGTLFRLALLTTRYPETESDEVEFGESLIFLFSRETMTSYSERFKEKNSYTDRISELENVCLEIKRSLENFKPQAKYFLPAKVKEKIKVLTERFKK